MAMITRDIYKKIKGMNREELSAYLSNLYRVGVKDGNITENMILVSRAVKNTIGIGPVLYERIMNNYKYYVREDCKDERNV